MIGPEVPESLKHGHEILCSELKNIVALGSEIGAKAQLLDKIMSAHFKREEEYALPPLGLLLALADGNWDLDSTEAIKMSEILKSKLSELKKEHDNISEALENLKKVALQKNNLSVNRFVKDLTQHVDIEDQVLYPATILVGNYLKQMKKGN